jgi:hypothetical protein
MGSVNKVINRFAEADHEAFGRELFSLVPEMTNQIFAQYLTVEYVSYLFSGCVDVLVE